jgi:hypothetical protein
MDAPGGTRVPAGAPAPHAPWGWSLRRHRHRGHGPLLPAPGSPRSRGDGPGLEGSMKRFDAAPRTRGDGPAQPARQEPDPRCSRTRGDPSYWPDDRLPALAGMVPRSASGSSSTGGCSPHSRGSSLGIVLVAVEVHLPPAPARMVPASVCRPGCRSPVSRTRGDGPDDGVPCVITDVCFPHPQRWSRRLGTCAGVQGLLLAPAEMGPGYFQIEDG